MLANASAAKLIIEDLELHVYLGWSQLEREDPQTVLLGMHITFHEPPRACLTDHLENTICYATLVQQLRTKLKGQFFNLIEHLAKFIYDHVRETVLVASNIMVRIKKHPKIPGLAGFVAFEYYGDTK
ncbi:MAG: dihydroneopterin aldolase [Gammaproteobacteria bacterium]|nr:dihydroneopterin aldolase [Gammaproteobacteria bacterium]